MTSSWIFGGIGFVLGLLGGAVGFGSLCTREARAKIKTLEDQNDEMAEEIEALKAELRKKKETKAEKKENEMRSYKEYKTLVEERGYKAEAEADDEDDEVDLIEDDSKEENFVGKGIYIISPEEYKHDMDLKQTEALTYYRNDKVLTDIAEDRVRGEAGLIGKEAMDKLTDENFTEPFLYVCNDIENTMYEIEINTTGSWYRDVLGMEV